MSSDADRPDAPSDRPTAAERIWHFLALFSLGSLFAIYGLLRLFGSEDAGSIGNLVLLTLQSLPLLAFLPALLAGSARAAALLSFVSVIYFGAGVLTIVDPAQRVSGAAEIFFALLLFVSTAYFARQRGVRDAARAGAAPPASGAGQGPPPEAP